MIRSSVRAAISLILAGGLGLASTPAVASMPLVVIVTGGEISGHAADGIVEYLGIPFAAPTGGGARFSPPRPVPPWPGVRPAHHHGPQCPQNGYLPGLPPTGPTSEDCLTIDVYAPDRAPGRLLPVMVFLHGGGYVTGSNSQYDAPTRMVADGDVIVAVPNYRLGPFGFMSLPELAAESGGATGTVGIQDQQAALRWVRENARAFGGDPGNVTIFGESAGGGSVCTHFAAPGSDDLFAKAIVQSGSCAQSPLVPGNRDDAFARSQRYAESIGCGDAATRSSCLRALPAAKLLDSPTVRFDGPTPVWVPSIDGVVVTRTLAEALAGDKRKRPLIVGSNSAEGALFVAESDYARGHVPDAASYERYVRQSFGGYADRVLARYPLDRYPSPSAAQTAVITDGLLACPALFTSRTARDTGHPLWQYEFDQAPFGDADPVLPGAFHAAELPYLFTGLMGVPIPWTGASAAFAAQMQRWWTTFAHTGDPNGPGASQWPAWPESAGQSSDGPTLLMRATGSVVIEDFAIRHHCAFWSERER
ncbi:carboxylesterase family protein [Streptomyces gardneri]|uniref:carboxylesterase/lipase family protein n=1 Tax=Nocardia TaxID=1817 RepID=UPI001357B678|nr:MULTISPECIES: carboxylesterase family protein [Nocardia]MBF6166195.1 carboxylesterase family protein [Streptomyces gardneri]MBF6205618.1 carboxylesterase family protein [Streptomyces gardneri]